MRNKQLSLFFLAVFFFQITCYNVFSHPLDKTTSEVSVKSSIDLKTDFIKPAIELTTQFSKTNSSGDFVILENHKLITYKPVIAEVYNRVNSSIWQSGLFLLLYPFHIFI